MLMIYLVMVGLKLGFVCVISMLNVFVVVMLIVWMLIV